MTSTEEPVNTPDWILRLENKNKRTHKLAHDIGAGASCLQCNSCPGLDLHFWRKLCKKCKCKKEEHDVKDDDGCEQFEILLGVGHKKQTPKRAYLNIRVAGTGVENTPTALKVENPSSSKNAAVSFDWVPPNVTCDLAEEYMLQLPAAKLPISGSDGAQYRRMQLEKQVPIHDLDASKCHGLTPVEVDRMQAYVDEIKSNVVGQGIVTKLLDPIKYKEQRLKQSVPHAGLVTGEPVKAQGTWQNTSGIVKHPAPHSLQESSTYGNGNTFPPHMFPTSAPQTGLEGNRQSSPTTHLPSDDAPETPPPPLPANPPPLMDPASLGDFGLGDLPGIPGQRVLKTPGSMIPPYLGGYSSNPNNRFASQVNHAHGDPKSQQGEQRAKGISGEDLDWPPPPSYEEMHTENAIEGNMGNGITMDSGKAKRIPEGELPDLMSGLRVAGDGTHEGIIGTVAQQWKCHKCDIQVKAGEVVVVAERAGENVCWHPQCFVCNVCKELLVDLIYFFRKGEVYCGRHFAEIMDIPRCNACDELIFVPNYTSAEGRSYHVKHFCCFECDIPLGGMKYILVEDQPNCLNCYQAKYGKTCHTCKQPIAAGDQRISWKELHWHVDAKCFCCASCKKFLLGGKFTVKENQPFCSRQCVEMYICPQTAL